MQGSIYWMSDFVAFYVLIGFIIGIGFTAFAVGQNMHMKAKFPEETYQFLKHTFSTTMFLAGVSTWPWALWGLIYTWLPVEKDDEDES